MINSPIYRFNSVNETGINEVPNNGYLIIDNNGTIEHYIKLANTDVTPNSTVQDFLNNPSLYKKADKEIGLESIGDGIRFSNGDYTKSVDVGEKSLDLVQNINPLVDEIGVSGNHSVGFGVDNLITGRNCIVQGRSNIVLERNNAVFGNGNISTAYEGFISGSTNVLGMGDVIDSYNSDDNYIVVKTDYFYNVCKEVIEDENSTLEQKEVYITVFDGSMDVNSANFLHIKTTISDVGENDADKIIFLDNFILPEGYYIDEGLSNIVFTRIHEDYNGYKGAESIIVGHNCINAGLLSVNIGYQNVLIDDNPTVVGNVVTGYKNKISKVLDIVNINGGNNKLSESTAHINGDNNNVAENSISNIYGSYNTTFNNDYSFISGFGNISSSHGSLIYGVKNLIGKESYIYNTKDGNDIYLSDDVINNITDWEEDDELIILSIERDSSGISQCKIDSIDTLNNKITIKEEERYQNSTVYGMVGSDKGIIINKTKTNNNEENTYFINIGYGNAGYAYRSINIGLKNQFFKDSYDSFALGKNLSVLYNNQFILGSYNLETQKDFIIGSGTSNDNRKNALEIDFNTDELFANTSLETLRQSDNNVLTTKEYILEKVQITRNDFDAEQDQTDFEIDGLYSYIEVLQNGLELRTNKYSISEDTDNNKTTISLNDGADENDWILIKSMK